MLSYPSFLFIFSVDFVGQKINRKRSHSTHHCKAIGAAWTRTLGNPGFGLKQSRLWLIHYYNSISKLNENIRIFATAINNYILTLKSISYGTNNIRWVSVEAVTILLSNGIFIIWTWHNIINEHVHVFL